MAIYSMVQTLTIMILYSIGYESRLRDAQFLWIDLFLIFPLSFLMSRTRPRDKLSKKKPPASLLARSILVSIALQLVVHSIFQVAVYAWTSWNYLPANHPDYDAETNQDTRISVLFVFSNFQYIASVLAFSIGKPFRRPMWTNRALICAFRNSRHNATRPDFFRVCDSY
jgi:cation-transporting ATPase 13A3/4/5